MLRDFKKTLIPKQNKTTTKKQNKTKHKNDHHTLEQQTRGVLLSLAVAFSRGSP